MPRMMPDMRPAVAIVLATEMPSGQPYWARATPTALAVPCPPWNPKTGVKPKLTGSSGKNGIRSIVSPSPTRTCVWCISPETVTPSEAICPKFFEGLAPTKASPSTTDVSWPGHWAIVLPMGREMPVKWPRICGPRSSPTKPAIRDAGRYRFWRKRLCLRSATPATSRRLRIAPSRMATFRGFIETTSFLLLKLRYQSSSASFGRSSSVRIRPFSFPIWRQMIS